jgi:hypothetical protein
MTDSEAWLKLQNYFEIMHLKGNDDLAAEVYFFDRDWGKHKIVYSGSNIKLAKQLVNKKFLVIEKKR